jgi:hypothetical protein
MRQGLPLYVYCVCRLWVSESRPNARSTDFDVPGLTLARLEFVEWSAASRGPGPAATLHSRCLSSSLHEARCDSVSVWQSRFRRSFYAELPPTRQYFNSLYCRVKVTAWPGLLSGCTCDGHTRAHGLRVLTRRAGDSMAPLKRRLEMPEFHRPPAVISNIVTVLSYAPYQDTDPGRPGRTVRTPQPFAGARVLRHR